MCLVSRIKGKFNSRQLNFIYIQTCACSMGSKICKSLNRLAVYRGSPYLIALKQILSKCLALLSMKPLKFLFETVECSNWIAVKFLSVKSSLECIHRPDLDTLQLYACVQFPVKQFIYLHLENICFRDS